MIFKKRMYHYAISLLDCSIIDITAASFILDTSSVPYITTFYDNNGGIVFMTKQTWENIYRMEEITT